MSKYNTRSIEELINLSYNQGGNFANSTNHLLSELNFAPTEDRRLNLRHLTEVFMSCPTWLAIFRKNSNLILSSSFRVNKIEKDGEYKQNKVGREYIKLLDGYGLDSIFKNLMIAEWGLGLGNALIYPTKQNGKLVINCDPFVMNGRPRVQVTLGEDKKNLKVAKYSILDNNGRVIPGLEFKGDDERIYHYKSLNPNGNYAFASNGVVVAYKYAVVEYNMMRAIDGIYNKGMKAATMVSLDKDSLRQAGLDETAIEMKDKMTEQKFHEMNTIENSGAFHYIDGILNFQPIQMNASQMRTTETSKMNSDNICKAMGFDPSLLDNSLSKYDNYEKSIDQMYQDIRPVAQEFENIVNKCILPQIDPKIDQTQYRFTISRQFTSEEARIKEIIDKQNSNYFANLKSANETLSASGIVVVPNAEKLAMLEANGFSFIKPQEKEIDLTPSTNEQIADSFTGVSYSENINKRQEPSVWENIQTRLDKSFKAVLEK